MLQTAISSKVSILTTTSTILKCKFQNYKSLNIITVINTIIERPNAQINITIENARRATIEYAIAYIVVNQNVVTAIVIMKTDIINTLYKYLST